MFESLVIFPLREIISFFAFFYYLKSISIGTQSRTFSEIVNFLHASVQSSQYWSSFRPQENGRILVPEVSSDVQKARTARFSEPLLCGGVPSRIGKRCSCYIS